MRPLESRSGPLFQLDVTGQIQTMHQPRSAQSLMGDPGWCLWGAGQRKEYAPRLSGFSGPSSAWISNPLPDYLKQVANLAQTNLR